MSKQNAERVITQVDAAGNWMANALDQLASKMGTTVDYLWPIFVKEQIANGITLAVCSVIVVVVVGNNLK